MSLYAIQCIFTGELAVIDFRYEFRSGEVEFFIQRSDESKKRSSVWTTNSFETCVEVLEGKGDGTLQKPQKELLSGFGEVKYRYRVVEVSIVSD